MNGRGAGDGSLSRDGQRYDGVHEEGHSAKNRGGNGARAAPLNFGVRLSSLEARVSNFDVRRRKGRRHSAENRGGTGASAAGSRLAEEESALEIAVCDHWR